MPNDNTPTTPADDPDHFSLADMIELRDWAEAAAAKGWTVEEQADPRHGQVERIGNLPGHGEFVSFSAARARTARHTRVERRDGTWTVRPVWVRRAPVGVFPTLRRALEHLCGTIAFGLRQPLPGESPDGYPLDDGEQSEA